VEIKTDSGHWSEWFTALDSELNERLARENYKELKQLIERKVMV
jgi:hypothetical protein